MGATPDRPWPKPTFRHHIMIYLNENKKNIMWDK